MGISKETQKKQVEEDGNSRKQNKGKRSNGDGDVN